MRQGERGQILPGLLVVMLALLAVGVLMFQVGKAAVLRSNAQTAADAAALAGAEEIKRQLMAQWATTGTTQLPVDEPLVRAQMRRYAKKNGATLIESSVVIQGVDVKAAVTTDRDLGAGAKGLGEEDAEGEAHARGRIELTPVLGSGGSIGPVPGGGGGSTGPAPKISGKEWKQVEEKIGTGAPTCDDMVALGRFLQEQGFVVGENAAFGPVGAHDPRGYHYRCGNRGAIDVNFGPPGDLVKPETDAVDPIIAPLRELGFRTIWRAAGHYNHLHVDVANSGPIGAGSGGADGGFAGPLEDVLMEVRLIDWNPPTAPFFGLGGVGGGYFGGPPDPEAARAICSVARRLGASDKVLLAAYEAAIVESGVHSLPYGDLDSMGLFQQRDSWGSYAQRMNPSWASAQFISRAIRQDEPWMSAGQLAQDVQVSAFPERYDQRRVQALSLIATYCSK